MLELRQRLLLEVPHLHHGGNLLGKPFHRFVMVIGLDGESSRPVRGSQFVPRCIRFAWQDASVLCTRISTTFTLFLYLLVSPRPLWQNSFKLLCVWGLERRPKRHVVHLACSQPHVESSMYLLYWSYRREKPIENRPLSTWDAQWLVQKRGKPDPWTVIVRKDAGKADFGWSLRTQRVNSSPQQFQFSLPEQRASMCPNCTDHEVYAKHLLFWESGILIRAEVPTWPVLNKIPGYWSLTCFPGIWHFISAITARCWGLSLSPCDGTGRGLCKLPPGLS